MKCTKCGFEFEEGLFCPECGTKYDETEAKRIDVEKQIEEEKRQEVLRQEAEEKRIQDELRRKEEKEKRDLEIEKAKVEQERLANERIAHEAELMRQQNEKARIEQENRKKIEEQEKKNQEELARTFHGILYDSIDEMNFAKAKYNEQVEMEKKEKKVDKMAIWSFVLSVASYPLLITLLLWIPSLIASFVFGTRALKDNTSKRNLVIAGFIINGVFVLMMVLSAILYVMQE